MGSNLRNQFKPVADETVNECSLTVPLTALSTDAKLFILKSKTNRLNRLKGIMEGLLNIIFAKQYQNF